MADIKNLRMGDILISPIYLGDIQIGKIYLNGFTIYDINGSGGGVITTSSFAKILSNVSSWQVFGDSISTTYNVTENQIWHNVITSNSNYSHITKYNNSESGSEISDGGRTDVDSFIERYRDLNSSVELLTVFGGVNDWCHNNIPLGNYNDATTIDSLYGALNTLLPNLKIQCPNATIIWLLPLKTKSNQAVESTNANGTNAFGLRLTDYIDAIIAKCKQYGIGYVELYGVEGLDPDVNTNNFASDGLHPNASGHQALATYLLEKAIVKNISITEGEGEEEENYITYEGYPIEIENGQIDTAKQSYLTEIYGNTTENGSVGEFVNNEYIVELYIADCPIIFGKKGRLNDNN